MEESGGRGERQTDGCGKKHGHEEESDPGNLYPNHVLGKDEF